MKASIITIHNSPNYGACLQTFALWKYIDKQGIDCEIIDLYRPYQKEYIYSWRFVPMRELKLKRFLPGFVIRFIKKILLGGKEPQYFSDSAKVKFDAFNASIKQSGTYRGIDELYRNPPLCDLYITGSDQVWNPDQSYCIEPYFLTFAPKGKTKISYAASIGLSDLRKNEKDKFKAWLSAYTAISVREKQAKALLESFSGLTVAQEGGMKLIVLNQIQPDCKDGSYMPVTNAGPQEFLGYIAKAAVEAE